MSAIQKQIKEINTVLSFLKNNEERQELTKEKKRLEESIIAKKNFKQQSRFVSRWR